MVAKTYVGPLLKPEYDHAPDETWISRDCPPLPGVVVEGFYCGRGHRPDTICLVMRNTLAQWCDTNLKPIVFIPSFWRDPLHRAEDKTLATVLQTIDDHVTQALQIPEHRLSRGPSW